VESATGLRSLVVVYSYHHHNTEKVARAMAEVLGAEVKAPKDVRPEDLAQYDLVGLGSGIYGGLMHKDLLALVNAAPQTSGKRAFLFSTMGAPAGAKDRQELVTKRHAPLRAAVEAKGYQVLGEFDSPGWLTLAFLALFGGINRGRPNEADLASAREFALEMKGKAAG